MNHEQINYIYGLFNYDYIDWIEINYSSTTYEKTN
jgi:hypothetical protein